MTDAKFDTQNDIGEDDIDPILTEQNEYDRINNMIDDMYDDIIARFQSGSVTISNPYIMRFMTKNDFIDWIINNNEYIANILESK